MTNPITIEISQDEALVLLGFFERFVQDCAFRLRNNAEYVAFAKLSAQLDKALVAPLQDDHLQQLDAARARLASGYQGVAPGVEPVGRT